MTTTLRSSSRRQSLAYPEKSWIAYTFAFTFSLCLLAGSSSVSARTFCCSNAQGRNVCGDILPQECYGRAYREMTDRGMTVRQVDAPLTAEQRAQREFELERKKKEELAAREEKRRNEALLTAYASERDIDFMRDHTLEPITAIVKETTAKQLEAQKHKKYLEEQLEFYKKKPVPVKLKEQIKTNENDIKTLATMLETKKQEMEQINARFAEEKQRFNQLSQGTHGTRKEKPLPPASTSR